jgi:hypothetical protein
MRPYLKKKPSQKKKKKKKRADGVSGSRCRPSVQAPVPQKINKKSLLKDKYY